MSELENSNRRVCSYHRQRKIGMCTSYTLTWGGGGMWGGGGGNLVVIGEGRVMICRRVGKEKRVVLASRDGGDLGIP